MIETIEPNWPAPPWVNALSTIRSGGVSKSPYDSLNLALHTGDDSTTVWRNRALLQQHLPSLPIWLEQVHGNRVVVAEGPPITVAADGCVTRQEGMVCTVMTADCLPVLLCSSQEPVVGALHAGWRGLANGVIANGIERLGCPADEVIAWLGPAIGPEAFEVGPEVRAAFLQLDEQNSDCFRPATRAEHWFADIYALARLQLSALGVAGVFGGSWCTVSDPGRFFSFRRDGTTGRNASLIWLDRSQR